MTAGPSTSACEREPTLRADARRNRDRIVAAAAELFVEQGVEVPLDAIARRADVGIGTLYRRFPDRTALNTAVALRVFTSLRDLADTTAAHTDGPVLDVFVDGVADLHVGALTTSLLPVITDPDRDPRLEETFEEVLGAIGRLVDLAIGRGELRDDATADDLLLLLALLMRPLEGIPTDLMAAVTPRVLRLAIDGLRPRGDARALPDAPARPRPEELELPRSPTGRARTSARPLTGSQPGRAADRLG